MLNFECVKFPARTGAQSGQLAFSPPTHEPNGDRAPAAAHLGVRPTLSRLPHDSTIRQSSIPLAYRMILK